MAQIIKATEVVRSFSDIMNRVYYKGESFDVQKGNNIVARISPANPADKPKKTLKEFFEHAPILDPEDSAQFKKVVYEARQKYDFEKDNKWK
ncbi:MAG TPA: antitoxin [Rickettsia endosymbiont of Pyrocoelia pectoralis]|nr:antitoxin [Rickettsia endosymbiont of Pyrocoelia pectoralis]